MWEFEHGSESFISFLSPLIERMFCINEICFIIIRMLTDLHLFSNISTIQDGKKVKRMCLNGITRRVTLHVKHVKELQC